MGSWVDDLRQASFRGVPFFVDVADSERGRKSVVHEFVNRSLPYVEDLGRETRKHAMDAYLVGDDVAAQRNRFLAALEKPGSGKLVHPYLGGLIVAVGPIRVRHSANEGRVVRFGLVFIETDEPTTEAVPVPTAGAASAAAALEEFSLEQFAGATQFEAVPDWTFESMLGEVGRVLDLIRTADLTAGEIGAAADLVRAINDVGNGVADLLRGGNLPGRLQEILNSIEGALAGKLAAIEFYLELDGFRAERVGYLGEAGQQADANAAALEQLLRELAIANAARLATEAPWASYDDALAARDRLLGRIDALSETAGDGTYGKLLALRGALCAAVPPAEESLPRLLRVELPRPTSALLLAYRAFGTPDKEEEILARNRPDFPAFLPAHFPLELLVDPV